MKHTEISALLGLTIKSIEGLEKWSDLARFHLSDGRVIRMEHNQDCCEHVSIEDVCGDVTDLIGTPIVRAEEPSSIDGHDQSQGYGHESFTWTYYILGTNKGTVTIRWYGSSNGYYSETAYVWWE